ncbi:glycine betaine ABC transporter substrate-binding protein [Terrabacter sp. GCM10028922]|uniref:glycine betaine ABC transporter substrate-binding protein n=1 Tax=Terrabacter sp. GCM10028922 TaxID=3273428 RepID=UPI003606EB79
MKKRFLTFPMRLGVPLTAVAVLAAGCASGTAGGTSAAGGGSNKTINMGVIPGWTDETGTAYLLKNVLEHNGFTVKITELSDNAPMYTALSKGDIDVLSSAWPEKLHKALMDRYGKNLEDVGAYYEGATSFLAVPTYSDIKSISDLPSHAAELDGKITGIEPGAGLTKATKDDVIPAYGLNKDFKLVLSSTTAMLTTLKKATEAKKPIVVTLWKPFWANGAFPVRALEDPKGAYGAPENLHVLARKGFSADNPKVANLLKNFKLDDKQYQSLEDLVANKFGQGEEDKAVQAWLDKNPEYGTKLASYLK